MEGQEEARSHRAIRVAAAGPGLRRPNWVLPHVLREGVWRDGRRGLLAGILRLPAWHVLSAIWGGLPPPPFSQNRAEENSSA